MGTFTAHPQGVRYSRFKQAAEELKKSFASLKVFWSKDFFTQFMAESQIVKEKELVQKTVQRTRRQISYSLPDMVQDSNDLIMRMTGAISFKDANPSIEYKPLKTTFLFFCFLL